MTATVKSTLRMFNKTIKAPPMSEKKMREWLEWFEWYEGECREWRKQRDKDMKEYLEATKNITFAQ